MVSQAALSIYVRASIRLGAFAAKHQGFSTVLVYSLTALQAYSMAVDPGQAVVMGPGALIDDLYSFAAAGRRITKGVPAVLFGARDSLKRATGMFAKLTPRSLDFNSILGPKPAVTDLIGWKEFVEMVPRAIAP